MASAPTLRSFASGTRAATAAPTSGLTFSFRFVAETSRRAELPEKKIANTIDGIDRAYNLSEDGLRACGGSNSVCQANREAR
jgi:hypothetical protein